MLLAECKIYNYAKDSQVYLFQIYLTGTLKKNNT